MTHSEAPVKLHSRWGFVVLLYVQSPNLILTLRSNHYKSFSEKASHCTPKMETIGSKVNLYLKQLNEIEDVEKRTEAKLRAKVDAAKQAFIKAKTNDEKKKAEKKLQDVQADVATCEKSRAQREEKGRKLIGALDSVATALHENNAQIDDAEYFKRMQELVVFRDDAVMKLGAYVADLLAKAGKLGNFHDESAMMGVMNMPKSDPGLPIAATEPLLPGKVVNDVKDMDGVEVEVKGTQAVEAGALESVDGMQAVTVVASAGPTRATQVLSTVPYHREAQEDKHDMVTDASAML